MASPVRRGEPSVRGVSPIAQSLTAADYSAPAAGPASFAEFITALKAGNSYLNLHTSACGGGEIRGQIK